LSQFGDEDRLLYVLPLFVSEYIGADGALAFRSYLLGLRRQPLRLNGTLIFVRSVAHPLLTQRGVAIARFKVNLDEGFLDRGILVVWAERIGHSFVP